MSKISRWVWSVLEDREKHYWFVSSIFQNLVNNKKSKSAKYLKILKSRSFGLIIQSINQKKKKLISVSIDCEILFQARSYLYVTEFYLWFNRAASFD